MAKSNSPTQAGEPTETEKEKKIIEASLFLPYSEAIMRANYISMFALPLCAFALAGPKAVLIAALAEVLNQQLGHAHRMRIMPQGLQKVIDKNWDTIKSDWQGLAWHLAKAKSLTPEDGLYFIPTGGAPNKILADVKRAGFFMSFRCTVAGVVIEKIRDRVSRLSNSGQTPPAP